MQYQRNKDAVKNLNWDDEKRYLASGPNELIGKPFDMAKPLVVELSMKLRLIVKD